MNDFDSGLLMMYLLTSAAGGRHTRHIAQVGVLQRCSGRDPLLRVIGEELGEEVVTTRTELGWQDLAGVWWRLPPGEHWLVVWQLSDSWPRGLCGSAECSEDSEELINLRVSGEQRSSRDHLSEDTSQTPGVHTRAVELGS